jgi:putative oxidoreductase
VGRRKDCTGAVAVPPILPGTSVAHFVWAMTTAHAMHHDPSAAQLAIAEYELQQRTRHNHLQARQAQLYALGRVLVAALFIVSAIAKLADFQATVNALSDTLAEPRLLVPIGIGIELLGGAMLLSGLRARAVATGLIGYLATVTLLINHDLSQALNRSMALSNLAFAGALLMVVAHGAGALSIDRLTKKG